jgi:hypothetical protein
VPRARRGRRSKIFDRELEKPSGFEVLRKKGETSVKSAGQGISPLPIFHAVSLLVDPGFVLSVFYSKR